ncbi:molybdopterin-dependent oxidoreductase [Natrinema sp. 1APR25-10V2]|uniref:molybdopterin-dependent oxidoreductase n=1 Tax=Natrinema sp. 1APR25-10V2 TaxID=2951081 RepID=UPI002874DAEE|nr:molybdopterin-dependent oxidoreductase [Natrinema sp. 1APR25-10V2]MDS0475564.1 molybdopterin-dependent oxidoreductase [Natrinema sp. 1APR25-10V2]
MTFLPTEWLAARRRAGDALVVAWLAGIAGVVGSFAVASFTPSFVATPIADSLARNLPGAVITFAIVVLGDLGAKLNVVAALVLATLLLAGIALVGIAAGRRIDGQLAGPLIATTVSSVVTFVLTGASLASIAAGVGVGSVLGGATLLAATKPAASDASGRRRVLGGAASALAFGIGSYLLGEHVGSDRASPPDVAPTTDESVVAAVDASLAEADEKSLDIGGLEPLVSEGFYQVDINAADPIIDADEWSLTVTGAVEDEPTYSYDEIRNLDPESRFVTLRCVGESLNGKKLDNALWTGVPIMDLLEPAAPADECCVMLRGADGFYEEFPLSALRDGFLAYEMNGDVLPRGHGFPVRALIPGHWGEINVKWLTEIEVLEGEQDGYWEKRGWHGTGPVETVAKLHAVNDLTDGRVEVAGHAYAGIRGIKRVEVSTDGGESWADAELSEPLPGDDVWRQWRYRYDPPPGSHEVVVRATDGTGSLQPEEESDAFPSGPTGWVSRTIDR